MPKILNIIKSAYHGTVEEQDDSPLWITAAITNAGAGMSVLLRSNAVNYGLTGQDASGLVIGGIPLSVPPTIDKDVQELMAKGVPVYAVKEDLEARGIDKTHLLKDINIISEKEVAKLWDEHDDIWHW